jgi:hypothetical protein
MLEITWKKESVSDVVNVLLGAFLFLTPWFYGYASEATASWNAWVSGIVVAGLAVAALAAYAEWEEWLNLLVGLWVAVSPWLVGAPASTAAKVRNRATNRPKKTILPPCRRKRYWPTLRWCSSSLTYLP